MKPKPTLFTRRRALALPLVLILATLPGSPPAAAEGGDSLTCSGGAEATGCAAAKPAADVAPRWCEGGTGLPDLVAIPQSETLRRREPGAPGGKRSASVGDPAGVEVAGHGGRDSVKGWLGAAPGRRMEGLPAGARLIEDYDERLFVELPRSAMGGMATAGLVFAEVPDADILTVGGRRIDTAEGEPGIEERWKARDEAPGARRPLLLKFDAPVKPEWLEAVREAGGEIVQYQSHFGYLVFGDGTLRSRLKSLNRLAFSGEYHGLYKTDPAVAARVDEGGTITLRMSFFDLPGTGALMDEIIAGGARLTTLDEGASTSQWASLRHAVFEEFALADLPSILDRPEVYWAEEWHPARTEGERAAQITAGNITGGVPDLGYHAWLASQGADGAGVTVAIADSGFSTGSLATMHEDFTGRVSFATLLCAQNRDRDGHGTNVAGIAVGDPRALSGGTGLTDPGGYFWGGGSAPGAHLYVQKAIDAGDCGAVYAGQPNTLAQDAVRTGGAEIGSHSFTDGASPGSSYTTNAQVWDARVRDADTGVAGNQPYSVIFSAGNSGPNSGTLTSPKAAKNIIAVGATENYRPGQCPGVAGCGDSADDIDTLVSFSSRGPTSDNRIKPDISAPGHVITGALSSSASYSCFCDGGGGGGCCASVVDGSGKYSTYSGTSQASPRVAGASAVLYEWWMDQFGVFPSPAMNKALLVSGASDMGGLDAPNNDEGWGRVNLGNIMESPLAFSHVDQSSVIGTTGAGGAFSASYWVQDVLSPVAATLAWTDAPGAVSCNPCLVNDLDLSVDDGFTIWRGNNLANGLSTPGTTTDSLNNIEAVRVPPSSVCLPFDVRVEAKSLNGDGLPGNGDTTDQDFALIVRNASATPGPTVIQAIASSADNGCDADPFLDRRETVDLVVDIGNCGSPGSGVDAVLSVDSAPPGASVNISPSGPVSVGAIGAGATVQGNWQVSLDDNPTSFCGETLTLRVDFSDANSMWSDTVDVTLDADAFGLVTETDTADVDNSFAGDVFWALDNCRTTSSPTSWHMGQSDCTGIPRDALSRDLIFAYSLGTTDVLRELSFQHAFSGYQNTGGTLRDSVEVAIDPENDGTFVALETWPQGLGNPTVMSPAGPYDLSPFDAVRGNTIKIRFRFQSAANWVGGANSAPGWDVDDIVFKYDSLTCDAGSCPACANPSGLSNNSAFDALSCAASGNMVSWVQDPVSWNDTGGARTYQVRRDGSPIVSGGCSSTLAYGTTSCVDETALPGVAHTYQVRYLNGCAASAETAGAVATDLALAPPPVNDGTGATTPLEISLSGGVISLTWDAQVCAAGYNIYRGTFGGLYDHAWFTASGLDGGDSCGEPVAAATFTDPEPGTSHYFLVATDNGTLESNLDDSGVPAARPWAASPCSPH